ncbi:MAG: DUF2505 family protein [Deltaproteobacteria bacterium]|nr:DUF2505 family protein [Deltaproteobacteria bacterium]
MTETRIRHEFDCDEDTFWATFFDAEYTRRLFLEGLGFERFTLVSLDEKPDRIERVSDVVPKLGDLPGPLKKLAEGGAGYRERATFDRATRRMKTAIEPQSLRDKLFISGVQWTEALGPGRCRRVYDLKVEAKVFGLGSLIEGRITADVQKSYDQAAVFTARWLTDHPR